MKLRDTAERRPVTILHCDLVDSTQLVDRMDPEEFLGVVEQFLEMTSSVVEEFHGTVAGFTGDGIEAYFGYPVTTETPAADAVFAALRIRDALLSNQLNLPVQLQCRVGVATGIAVVGKPAEGGHLGRHLMAFGSVAHLAERLQSAAEPNQVFIDSETRKLAAQRFSFNDIGLAQLKGFENDVRIFEVVGPENSVSRFDFAANHPVAIAGRQYVFEVLRDRWHVALGGEGQIVHLVGDAGIGKSRALHEFESNVVTEKVSTYRLQCSSQHASSPLHPWIQSLPVLANLRHADTVAQRLEKTRRYLSERLELPERLVDLSLSLMGIDESVETGPARVPPVAALTELHSTLAQLVVKESRRTPVLILFEDIQWIDATSSSWLELMAELASTETIFIGVTSRPGAAAASASSPVTTLSLVKLNHAEVRQLIHRLIDQVDGELSEESIDQIADRSDGNPLYIEELTAMFLEQSQQQLSNQSVGSHMPVPLALQLSLLARIDRIEHGQELAQIAAVIGDSFAIEQMESLAQHNKSGVAIGLSELVSSNVLRSFSQGDVVLYEFRHSILQDAIYASLLIAKREQIHRNIAFDLQGRAEVDGRWSPEVVAHHFDSAKDWSGAFDNWVIAGEWALRSGATSEAITLLENAKGYIDQARNSPRHLVYLQRLHMAYGMAINAVYGAVADPGAQFKLASEIGEQLSDVEATVEALDWQFGVAFNSGQLELCKAPAKRLIEIGHRSEHPTPFVAGSQALGMVYFNQGRFKDAVERFELLFAHEPDLVSGRHCYPSLALSYFAWSRCMLGERDEAFLLAERALESSIKESAHAYTIALSNCSYVYHSLGDYEKLANCNKVLNEHCESTGEFMYSRRAATMRDYLLTKRTLTQDYLPFMIENITALLDAKEEIELTFLYALLAESQIDLGLYNEAGDSLLTGIEIANRNGEMFCFAKMNSMMAIVVEHCPQSYFENLNPTHYIDQAIAVAVEQGAKPLEEEARRCRIVVESRYEGADNGMH